MLGSVFLRLSTPRKSSNSITFAEMITSPSPSKSSSLLSIPDHGIDSPCSRPFTPSDRSTNGLGPYLAVPRPTYSRSSSCSCITSSPATRCSSPRPKNILDEKNPRAVSAHSSHSVDSFDTTYDNTAYSVLQVAQHDDADLLPQWKRRLYRLGPLFTFLAMGSYLLYFAYRIYCTYDAQHYYHETYVMAWLFISSEFCVASESRLKNLSCKTMLTQQQYQLSFITPTRYWLHAEEADLSFGFKATKHLR